MYFLKTSDKNFRAVFSKLKNREGYFSGDIKEKVQEILDEVKAKGDRAVTKFSKKYDRSPNISEGFEIRKEIIQGSLKKIRQAELSSLKSAYRRIEQFHLKQLQHSWIMTQTDGEITGQLIRPLKRVGMYVPGGKAVYPSSVLMNAIPARVAGVKEIVMVTPGSAGTVSPIILAAAKLCRVNSIFQVGGAQAIGALAYGTESIPKVDKIVGPGNIYVATAKRLVYGDVDVDMIAGPSEILIIADGNSDARFVASDMLSQAEHDERAVAILLTPDEQFAAKVTAELHKQIEKLNRKAIAALSIKNYGAVIITKDIHEAVRLANDVAPEHLELSVSSPWDLLAEIENAGAVFLGHYSPEAAGDYIAGPNHVLPTGGTARFFSPLSVNDFLKKTSIIYFSRSALKDVGKDIIRLAMAESLDAHAKSVQYRLRGKVK